MTELLPPLPDEEFRRVLCVVAHPDDMEFGGTSAAVAHWAARGVQVSYLLLTSGEAGMHLPPESVGPLRATEQRAACAAVGVSDLTILDHPDGVLMPTIELRRDIARQVRRVKPDAVVTTTFDVVAPWGLNQADHRAAGLSTLDAVRDADNRWVFPELDESEGLPPWGTRWLLVASALPPTHGVAVTEEDVERSVASLDAHREYLAALATEVKPREMIPAFLTQAGRAMGTDFAVSFRAWDLRGRPAGP